ncbi:hypothetical protein CLIB1423_12S01222 [[Candida] railenensis]|uniref:Uncharacterized protein n=1 Tax=[Candida] railenensis TaxID=45579 RepID=A0A9P0VZL2_9ASCO|nr:hypothetical protein CLIB1423_12S01222 [[Candida] railenensis]
MPQFRKRKAESSSVTSSTKIENFLGLEDSPGGKIQPIKKIPDDDKVINALNKLSSTTTSETSDSTVVLKIIVSLTEAEYFTSTIDLITDQFKLTDFFISKQVEGSVDRFITLSGSVNSVCRASVYISYCLAAKLNNFSSSNSFTLKSNNYCLSFFERPRNGGAKSWAAIGASNGTRVFDYSDSYCRSNSLGTVYIRGDFHSIFNSLLIIIQSRDELATDGPYYIDDDFIQQVSVTGNYGNPVLFQRQEVNAGVLDNSTEEVLSFIEIQKVS